MIFRRPAPAPSETPAPMTEAEVLPEHANIMRKLAADMASQHLTLMLVGDGSPMNNLVRDTVGANRRSMEEAADHLQRLAGESRLRPPGLTLWQFVLRLGLGRVLRPAGACSCTTSLSGEERDREGEPASWQAPSPSPEPSE